MGVEYYKGKSVPLESIKVYKDVKYGLVASESGEGYYLYELEPDNIEMRGHFNVAKGTVMELEIDEGNNFGVRVFNEDREDKGFVKLPV